MQHKASRVIDPSDKYSQQRRKERNATDEQKPEDPQHVIHSFLVLKHIEVVTFSEISPLVNSFPC